MTTASRQSDSVAAFNTTTSSQLFLPVALSLRQNPIVFSFRTCGRGGMFVQWINNATANPANRNHFTITLTPDGSLQLDWLVQDTTDKLTLGDNALANGYWHTVAIGFKHGGIYVALHQGSRLIVNELFSNSTWRRYLWDADWGLGSAEVGSDLMGCMQGGPGLPIALSDSATETAVVWNNCPLDDDRSSCGESSFTLFVDVD